MTITIKDLLKLCLDKNASDLIITAGSSPVFRKDGEVMASNLEEITPAKAKVLIYSVLNNEQKKVFQKYKELDFSLDYSKEFRFRANVYMQKSTEAATFRAIPLNVPSFESLNLPEVIKKIALRPRGMILVTGPSGSGKSTTLAAIIDHINKTRKCHIITIEDPIEFIHKNLSSVIEQREISVDTDSFANALKHVVRQSPDVILVGELRDLETISTAITAAETGHLVLGTLHTIDAPQSISRIIDVFPSDQQAQIRLQFASALLAIVSQQLVKKADGRGRVPAVELLINNPAIRAQITHNDIQQIPLSIQTGRDLGMKTLNQSLKELFSRGLITHSAAASFSSNPEDFERLLVTAVKMNFKKKRSSLKRFFKILFGRKILLLCRMKKYFKKR